MALKEQLSTLRQSHNLSMKRLQVRQTAPSGSPEGPCLKLLLDRPMRGVCRGTHC